jgi:PAP2 superfamily
MAMAAAALYFAYLTGMGILRWRLMPAGIALLILAAVVLIGMPHIMPLVYLLTAYWLPALLVRVPNSRLEQQLLEFDRMLFGRRGLELFATKAPRWLLEYFELSYLLCYAVVPAGYVWLIFAGLEGTDMFWPTVFPASFACYGLLPWLPTRAPRAIEPPIPARSMIRSLNVRILDRASVQWNTFPSGHTAASVATALAAGSHVPVAGAVLGWIAVSIAIGSVVGRYHYAADAIVGAAVAVLSFMATSAIGL